MAAPYNDEYTDRQKTRIYTPSSERTRYNQDDAIGQTQAIAPKERLFDGISVPQILAGAAAAATSVALASYIGIAGSIIGAAVSSVVTVVSSQVYRRFLTASARKIKDAAPLAGSTPRNDAGTAEETVRMGSTPVRGARIAPSKLQARAKAEREATQRKVVVFSVMAGLLAVAVCAGGIWLATAGEGLGTKVGATESAEAQDEAVAESAQSPSAAQAPSGAAGAGAPAQADSGAPTSSDAASGVASGSTTTGQDANDSGASSSSGSSGDSAASGTTDGSDSSQAGENGATSQSGTGDTAQQGGTTGDSSPSSNAEATA